MRCDRPRLSAGDKTLVANYSESTASEDWDSFTKSFSTSMSQTATITLGFASAAAGAYVRGVVGVAGLAGVVMSATADVLTIAGVSGKGADGLRAAATTVNSVVDMLAAPFECLTPFSSGGEDTMLFAMQNLVGGGLALGATYGSGSVTQFGTSSRFTRMVNSVEKALAAAEPTLAAVSGGALAIKATIATANSKAAARSKGLTAKDVWTSGAADFGKCMQKKVSTGLDYLLQVTTFGDGEPGQDANWMPRPS